VVTLPTSERNTSLNLSHAVALALSEWFRQVRQPKRKEIRHSLTAAERSLLREHWLGFIDSMVFLGEQDAAQRRIALARAMERMPWHPEEYQLLLAAFAKARSRFAALRKEKEQPPQ
jgi:tRNA C32,U32 (ribose-2'-O)-methylase TrmJ